MKCIPMTMHTYDMNAPEEYSYEMHAREMHAHETHGYEIHALEMHTRKVWGKSSDLPPYKWWYGGRFVKV